MKYTPPLNPFEPLYFAGLNIPPEKRWKVVFRPGFYCYEPPGGFLAANQIINQDVLHIHPNSDFMLMGVYCQNATTGLNPFLVQLADDRGYQLYGNFVYSTAVGFQYVGAVSFKTPHILRASGKLFISIQQGALRVVPALPEQNTWQMIFTGIKVFRVKDGIIS